MFSVAGLLATVVIALGWGILASLNQTTPQVVMNGTPTPMAPRPKSQAPKDEAQRVHLALHAIGRICESVGTTNRTALVRPHIDTILDFARRFPNVSFPVDDETGATVSLLIVARDGVRTCAPSLVDTINSALPKQYQLSGSTN